MAITAFTSSAPDDVLSLASFDFGFALHAGLEAKVVGGGMTTQQSSPHMSSPDSASAAHFADPDADRDDDDDTNSNDDADDGPDAGSGPPTKKQAGGRRGKSSSAERRATHNAIERARRESLNGRFLELAGALPTMANVKRPSKSVIVNKSLEWIYESQVREHNLVKENHALRAELNELRARLNMPPASTPAASVTEVAPVQSPSQVQTPAATSTGFQSQPAAALVGPCGYFSVPPSQQQQQQHPVSFAELAHVPAHMLGYHTGLPAVGPRGAGSPYHVSDAGSDASSQQHLQPKEPATTGLGSPRSFSSVSDTFSSVSNRTPDDSAHHTTTSTTVAAADTFAALQAAYSQQQQYAALASVASSSQANQPWLMF